MNKLKSLLSNVDAKVMIAGKCNFANFTKSLKYVKLKMPFEKKNHILTKDSA